MTIYLPGLDNRLHNGAAGDTTAITREFVEASIGSRLEAFKAKLRVRFSTEPVFALFADHGHIPARAGRRLGFDNQQLQSALAPKAPNGQPAYQPTYIASNRFDERANVLFQPEGGIAHVYVAGNPGAEATAKWAVAPTEERLKPLVDALVGFFGATRGTEQNPRPFAQILVRVGGFGSAYQVVSGGYDPQLGWDVNGQLQELSSLDPDSYLSAAARVTGWASENTGDIVLLANMDAGFYLDANDLTSTHGSLSARDGVVPLAFSYPGATSKDPAEDTRLQKIREYLGIGSGGSAPIFTTPTEANSARCLLGVIQLCR